jgi:hypothetical protein
MVATHDPISRRSGDAGVLLLVDPWCCSTIVWIFQIATCNNMHLAGHNLGQSRDHTEPSSELNCTKTLGTHQILLALKNREFKFEKQNLAPTKYIMKQDLAPSPENITVG